MNNEEIFKKVEIAVHQIELAKEFLETIEDEMGFDKVFNIINSLRQDEILHLATILKKDVIFNGQLQRMREYKNHFNCRDIEELFADERPIFDTNDIIEIKDQLQELGYEPNVLIDTLSIYLFVDGNLENYLEKSVLYSYENTTEEYNELNEFLNIIKNDITVSDLCDYQFGKSKEFNTIDYDKFFELKRDLKDYKFFNLEESTFEKFNLFDDDGIALTHIADLAQHFDKDEVSKKVDEYDWICHQTIAHYCDECINQGELLEIVPTLAKDYNGTYSFNESNMDNSDLDNCIDTEFLNNETERRR